MVHTGLDIPTSFYDVEPVCFGSYSTYRIRKASNEDDFQRRREKLKSTLLSRLWKPATGTVCTCM